jgi:hypothetical protein
MGELVVNMFTSLDGVLQGPGAPDEDPEGGFEYGGWQAPYLDEESGKVIGGQIAGLEALLLGRKTYEIFAAYWPGQPAEDPARVTIPTPSWPGTNGGVGLTGQSPFAACMSVWHSPEASILTSTCPSPGSGTGRSSMTSGCLNSRTTAAFIAVLLPEVVRIDDSMALGRGVGSGPTATASQDL